MPARSLYVNQEVKISTNAGAVRYLPVQSASCEVTRPIEDILSFGVLGSLARAQLQVSTCKSDIKTYLPNTTGTGTVSNASRQNLVDAALINALTGESLAGQTSSINVSPNGFSMSGILASLSIDVANGQFATADLSFVGVGEPDFASAPTGASFSEASNMPKSFTPVTSTNVSGELTSGCPNSFKFNLDLPNETISCLGGVLTGRQLDVTGDFLQVGKPPFKATASVEGLAVDLPTNPSTAAYVVGKLQIVIPAAQVTSRSYSNAVGQAGANYSWTVEATSATFTDVP